MKSYETKCYYYIEIKPESESSRWLWSHFIDNGKDSWDDYQVVSQKLKELRRIVNVESRLIKVIQRSIILDV
jgi:hypothetical protein